MTKNKNVKSFIQRFKEKRPKFFFFFHFVKLFQLLVLGQYEILCDKMKTMERTFKTT